MPEERWIRQVKTLTRTDLGFKLPSKVKIDLFKGYDLGLLGDIHKRQFINKDETIGYWQFTFVLVILVVPI